MKNHNSLRRLAFLLAFIMAMTIDLPICTLENFDFIMTANAEENVTDNTSAAVQPTLGDGTADDPYQIANYSNLVWFQQYVDSGNYSVNAVLTEDITANENLLDENGKVTGVPEHIWTPICDGITEFSMIYTGTFDGQGHTISGLYAPERSGGSALFLYSNGTIKNTFITDSYFDGSNSGAASFVGGGFEQCVIENCGSDAVVLGDSSSGGIGGSVYGKITNCFFSGSINEDSKRSNAIVSDYYNEGTLTNCYYLDTCGLNSDRAEAKTAEQFASGEVTYLLNNGVTDGTQAWYQTIGTDALPNFTGKVVCCKDNQYINGCDEHSWSSVPTSVIEENCTDDGYDVYTCTVCGANKNVPNGKTALGHSFDDEEICIVCGAFNVLKPTTGDGSVDNPYQIANYSNLVWFQQYVDNGNYSINAILTADITANENLLNENREVSGTPRHIWTPINKYGWMDDTSIYSGVFDGQGHTIKGLYSDGSSGYSALFANANGTIKNILITDSYFGGSCEYTAAFVSYGEEKCVIENCGSDAVILGGNYSGGISGGYYGKISNCYFSGNINGDSWRSNAIVSDYYDEAVLTNCYYLDTCGLTSTRAEAKTAEQFASGEVTYLLNTGVTDGTQTWYQTIGTDALPNFTGKIVCYKDNQYINGCDEHSWSSVPTSVIEESCTDGGYDVYTCTECGAAKNIPNGTTALGHSFDDNGLCRVCGAAEPPAVGDGSESNPYQIVNYGNLVWFGEYVDNGNITANAILTADITANENLLNENGGVSSTPEYIWMPICDKVRQSEKAFSGVFDGQGHTISGLCATDDGDECALFAKANGTIKNMFITDSYFGGSCYHAASFVGYGGEKCIIENCGSNATISGRLYCGGIAGSTKGEIINCYFSGSIKADSTLSGAIASDYYNHGVLTNCYYLDTCGLTSTRAESKTAEQFASGEVTYLLNDSKSDADCVWKQTIGENGYPVFAGEIVYYNEGAEFPYYNTECELGDVNLDGVVDRIDAALIMRHISGIEILKEEQLENADVNADSSVDLLDVTAVLKKCA